MEKPAPTVKVNDFSTASPAESLTRTEKGNVPFCVGSPEIPPDAAFSVTPCGSAPPLMLHV